MSAICIPGIAVVAVNAAERAALHEYYKSNTRPVKRSEGFKGMYAAGDVQIRLPPAESLIIIILPNCFKIKRYDSSTSNIRITLSI